MVVPRADVGRLGALPGVTRIFGEATYHTLAGPDAATINARELPEPPLSTDGAGIKIGIVDDGIDQTHPFFDPAGYTMPAGFPKGQNAFTTAKVIVARAFPPAHLARLRALKRRYDPSGLFRDNFFIAPARDDEAVA